MRTLRILFLVLVTLIPQAVADAQPGLANNPTAQRAGADWWSLQPIRRPTVPEPADKQWSSNPIDAFIKVKLEAKGLLPNPEADRRKFIRRVTLDLTGLLPTSEEVEGFLKESAANPQAADEKLVDRLLASTAYGERWGRHWLDVVRFAESHGYEMNTLRPNAWPYRDFVIRAFNRDTPYPRFILEQLAGDTIADADITTQAATGFIVGGPHDLVGNATLDATLQSRSDDLFDMTSTTSTAFLGLTVGCARCHDHKFDPISQRDFYRMQAVFAGVEHAERPIAPQSTKSQQQARIESLRKELLAIEQGLDALEPLARVGDGQTPGRPAVNSSRNVERFEPVEARFVRLSINATNDGGNPCIDELEIFGADEPGKNLASGGKASASSELPGYAIHKIAHLNEGKYGNSHSWISNEPHAGWAQIELPKPAKIDRIVWGRDHEKQFRDRLATDYQVAVSLDGHNWNTVANSQDRAPFGVASSPSSNSPERQKLLQRQTGIMAKISEASGTTPVYAGRFRTPEPTYLLSRGDVLRKGEEVNPAAIVGIGKPWSLPKNASDGDRRRGLAEWLADSNNPLPARVMANRVWHFHFGQGIVRTPSDFGFNGARPSHPELLDWLAAEYQANGWKLKPLHRLIVLSKTYRQSSRSDPDKTKVDAGNSLFWRFAGRRLEAEAIRDTILQTSGALDRRMGGAGYHLWNYSGYVIVFTPKPKLGPDEFRRMVYQFKPRLQQDGTFGAFDCPDGTGIAPRRAVSTTSLQAPNLLNDEFMYDQADRFAQRLRAETGTDIEAMLRRAFLMTLCREPSTNETIAAKLLVKEHGLASFCRALLNANEFVMME